MTIQCKRCGAAVPDIDVNIDERVAKCVRCNVVFDSTDRAQSRRHRSKIELPASFNIERSDLGASPGSYRSASDDKPRLTIERRWFRPGPHLYNLFFAAVWNSLLVRSLMLDQPRELAAWAGAVPFLAVGVVMGYFAIAGIFNTTRITIQSNELVVRHGPIPWPGNRRLDSRNIKQLYCVESWFRTGKPPKKYFDVKLLQHDGREFVLVGKLPQATHALYIEQEIELALELENATMPGEIAG